MKKPETKFKEKLLPLLRDLPNSWVVKVQQIGIRGTPDIIACVNGHFVALELKKDSRSRPDPLQAYNIARIKKAKGFAFVVSPENWAEVYAKLSWLSSEGDLCEDALRKSFVRG